MNFIDLFSGAGGLSEGFMRAGFRPIAHVEIDKAACNTLVTRTAFHYLKKKRNLQPYHDYVQNKISRTELYSFLPKKSLKSVIHLPIGGENNESIFKSIDSLKGKRNVDIIIGGPPCQAYSVVGRSRDENSMFGDSRNYLYKEYAKFLDYYKPKYFVFENVVGLKSARTQEGESYLQMMLDLFKEKGYQTEFDVLEARNFGVLQNRRRIILIGRRGDEKGFYPKFKAITPGVTVSEIFKDLPKLAAGEGNNFASNYSGNAGDYLLNNHIRNGWDFTTQHIARPHTEQDKEIYRIAVGKWDEYGERLDYNDLPSRLKTHKNTKSFTDRFKVVASNTQYSQTVVAHISKDGHYYIHPDITQNRSITPREAARLQSFPDDYFFEGKSQRPSRTSAFKQIGNAVPPLMAEKIAKQLKQLLKNGRQS